MAAPMTPAQMLKALKAEGVDVVEWPGWRDRCRCHSGSHEKGKKPTGRPWGEMHGVMVHHTGSDVQGDNYIRNILASGYGDLPGPLCQAAGRMNGEIILVASGRGNHAGGGDPAVLAKVIAESYTSLDPTKGNKTGTDGNDNFYGLECMYDGGQPMTAKQLDGAVRYAAAICRFHGWTAKSVIGHGEWSSDKWDPGRQDMDDFRRRVQARLDKPPTGGTSPKEWDEMATEAEIRKIVREEARDAVDRRVGDVVPVPSGYSKKDTNPTWHVKGALHEGLESDQKVRETLAKHGALLDAIVSKLLTPEEILAAAEAGAKAALDARITDAEVTLTVSAEEE